METTGRKCTKLCNKCNVIKSIDEFHLHKKRSDGRQTQCKECRKEIDAKRQVSGYWRKKSLKSLYNISESEYNVLLASQNQQCFICKTTVFSGHGQKAHVDHDHNDNQVRGLLCTNCNRGLGFFSDNIDKLSAAVHYLQHAKQTTQAILKQTRAKV